VEYRQLSRFGLKVPVVGLGAGHLASRLCSGAAVSTVLAEGSSAEQVRPNVETAEWRLGGAESAAVDEL
jgi:aryl-alcohol dehydrogenase-like predicted oxidoreductase